MTRDRSSAVSGRQEMIVDITALVAAFTGAGWGAVLTRDLMRGRRWRAAADAGVGSASLLNVVTLGRGSWSEHVVILIVGVGLIILSAVAFGADRGN
jgi:hypothetical protein